MLGNVIKPRDGTDPILGLCVGSEPDKNGGSDVRGSTVIQFNPVTDVT